MKYALVTFLLLASFCGGHLVGRNRSNHESQVKGCIKALFGLELSTVLRATDDDTKIDFCVQVTQAFQVENQ